MIDRYSTDDMSRIWSDFNKFKTWEKVELTVAEVMSTRGIIPNKSFQIIKGMVFIFTNKLVYVFF